MERNEYKQLMRDEMIREIPENELDQSFLTFEGKSYTPNQIMTEVDTETEMGQVFLEDFIMVKEGNPELGPISISRVEELMQEDLVLADATMPGWADQTLTHDDDGNPLSPKQLMAEVKARTPFGKAYAKEWLHNYYKVQLFTRTTGMSALLDDPNTVVDKNTLN